MRDMARRYPDEPYRQRLGAMAERLRRSRAYLTEEGGPIAGRYETPEQLVSEIDELQRCLVADRLPRVAYGEVQEFRWQVETFGFHLASLELRQHSEVHEAALAALRRVSRGDEPAEGRVGNPDASDGAASGGAVSTVAGSTVAGSRGGPAATDLLTEIVPGVSAGEVVATFRAAAAIQREFGEEACHRYVISFTRSAGDVLRVLDLAAIAADRRSSRAPPAAWRRPRRSWTWSHCSSRPTP